METISEVDKFCESYAKSKLLNKYVVENNKLKDMKVVTEPDHDE